MESEKQARLCATHFTPFSEIAGHTYYVYYFDSNGVNTTYSEGSQVSLEVVGLPHLFEDPLTGYKKQVKRPTVVVTIDAGKFKYRLGYSPNLSRTSSYEYVDF